RRGAGRSAALASSRTMHRSRHPITIRMAPKAELTSDHFVILPKACALVDRPPVSFLPVLYRQGQHRLSSTNVPAFRNSLGLGLVVRAIANGEEGEGWGMT